MCVLVNEHERVRDVVVTHMNDRLADPRANGFLGAMEDGVHHAGSLWGGLNPVETLAGVTEAVGNIFGEEVLFGEGTEVEHICGCY